MPKNKIKTLFMGTPEFAIPTLEALIKDPRFEIVAIITQPDKPVGRKQILTPPPVKIIAEKNNISVYQPDKISKFQIPNSNPESRFPIPDIDLIVVIAYGQIIPKNILEYPKYGAINIHGSLLPKYRGAACIQAAILNGDKESGVTIMQMDEGLDTGAIITQNKIELAENETAESLHKKLSELSAKILPDAIIDYLNGKIEIKKQENKKSSYVKQLKKEDGKIDWSNPAEKIERIVRAYNPWPGAHAQIKNQISNIKNIKILSVENKILKINNFKVGQLFLDNNKLCVQCGKDAIILRVIQPEGKKSMPADEFLKGHPDIIGSQFK